MAKILIVDDDPIVLRVVESTLKRAKHDITTAIDGHTALDHLAKSHFELLITDTNMPNGLSGIDVVKRVRSQEMTKRLPVMLMTGLEEKKDVQQALDAGADDYIVKPVDPDLLVAKVDSLLPQSHATPKFTDTLIDLKARWNQTEINVRGISEQGFWLWSPLPIPEKTKIVLECEIFAQIQIAKPTLRVWSCQMSAGRFELRASFVGLNNMELQKIRVWIHKQGKPTARSA